MSAGAARPILFSAPMVRAILAEVASPGTGKTQTRRLARFIPRDDYTGNLLFSGIAADKVSDGVWALVSRGAGGCWNERTKPLRTFAAGDRLWVRETWVMEDTSEYDSLAILPPDSRPIKHESRGDGGSYRLIPHYRATEPEPNIVCEASMTDEFDDRTRWKPGIHMPRWASRLTLEVTNVRVERLQDISEADAKAEGADRLVMDDEHKFFLDQDKGTHRCGFAGLWNHINGQRDGADWDTNPWIVAVTFRPHLVNIDAMPPPAAAAQRAKEPV